MLVTLPEFVSSSDVAEEPQPSTSGNQNDIAKVADNNETSSLAVNYDGGDSISSFPFNDDQVETKLRKKSKSSKLPKTELGPLLNSDKPEVIAH